MSVEMLVCYKAAEDGYHGYLGTLDIPEYRLLKKLSEECASSNVLSIDELKLLSDAKDLIAKAQIKLYEIEKEFSKTEKQRLKKVNQLLGEALESFDIYRKDAPQLDFLLSFCIIDAFHSEINEKNGEYESKNFQNVDMTEEEVLLLQESVLAGVIESIVVSEDFVNTISDWIACDGRRRLDEASMSEEFWDTLETEIEWWKDNIDYIEYKTEFNLTTMLFRSLRNNVLKCKRTGNPILSTEDWSKRMEIL